jgi:hypothetical protein
MVCLSIVYGHGRQQRVGREHRRTRTGWVISAGSAWAFFFVRKGSGGKRPQSREAFQGHQAQLKAHR